jgi:predicted nuclease of restriction endonuclease-like (RecB) superfamily
MEYLQDFNTIHRWILASQARVEKFFSEETCLLNWEIGEYIHESIESKRWGEKTVESLAKYLAEKNPHLKGFSTRNLWRMRQFFAEYSKSEILPPLVAQISWSHHTIILSKAPSLAEKEFYINLAIREKLSKRDLERQINSNIFLRNIYPNQILPPLVAELKNIPNSPFKGIYVFELLDLPNNFDEKDLRKAILANPKQFLLEFGNDLTLVGEEYPIQLGGETYSIDLLFYHRQLQCFLAVELKLTPLKPDHPGKSAFYLELLDKYVKKPHEAPSIGIIICKSVNKEVFEHAIARINGPLHAAPFTLNIPDKDFLLLKEPKPEERFLKLPAPPKKVNNEQ